MNVNFINHPHDNKLLIKYLKVLDNNKWIQQIDIYQEHINITCGYRHSSVFQYTDDKYTCIMHESWSELWSKLGDDIKAKSILSDLYELGEQESKFTFKQFLRYAETTSNIIDHLLSDLQENKK